LHNGAIFGSVDWAVGKGPVVGGCNAKLAWTFTPSDTSLQPQTTNDTFASVPPEDALDDQQRVHCLFGALVAKSIAPGKWNVSVTDGGSWKTACDVDVGLDNVTSVTFTLGQPSCTVTG